MAGGRFSIESVFKAVDRVSRPVTKMQNRVRKFTRATRKGVDAASRSFRNLGSDIKAASMVGVASVLALGAALLPVINTTAQFEQSLVNAGAKFPGMVKDGKLLEDQMKALEDVARKTGATTEFTASQSAEALNFLAMAGFSAGQAIGALPKIVDLATAAQVDLATASDIATDSLGAFGLATEDPIKNSKNLTRVIDVMAKTATSANTNMEQMMEAIKQGGPVATKAGASLETFLAMTGQLANAGIKGSDAGTTLKNVFTRLTGATGGAAKMLRRMGVSVKDSKGNMRDITDILGDFNKGLDGMGSADKLAAIKEVFGKIPLAGVGVLLDVGSAKLKKYRGQLEMSAGASAEMAKVMRNTLQGRIKTLNSSFESLQLTIGQTNSGPINALINGLTRLTRIVDNALKNNTAFGKTLRVVGGAVIFVTLAIATFSAVTVAAKVGMFAWAGAMKTWLVITKLATAAQWLWNVAMAANPIGAVIAAVLALIAVGILVARHWDELTEKWNKMSTAAKVFIGILALIFSPITVLIGLVVGLIKAGQWLVENWTWVGDFFKEFFRGFGMGFSVALDAVIGFASDLIFYMTHPTAVIEELWGNLWAFLPEPVQAFLEFFKPVTDALLAPFKLMEGAIDLVGSKISGLMDKFKVLDKIKTFGSDVFGFVKTGLFGDDKKDPVKKQTKASKKGIPAKTKTQVLIEEENARARRAGGASAPASTGGSTPAASPPRMVTPQERVARQIDETRTTANAEVTVRAEEGTSATMSQKKRSPLVALTLAPSGAF